jgi:hypothetical protein
MRALSWCTLLGGGILIVLLGSPSVGNCCPRRGYIFRGGYAYQPVAPASSTASIPIESQSNYREPGEEVVPGAPERSEQPAAQPRAAAAQARAAVPARAAAQPRLAPLSEQTGNDNFMYSGQ